MELNEMSADEVRQRLEEQGYGLDEYENEESHDVHLNDEKSGLWIGVGHPDRDTAYRLVLVLATKAGEVLVELQKHEPGVPNTHTEGAGGG